MAGSFRRSPSAALVVGGDAAVTEIVASLRALSCVAVGVNAWQSAMEMMEAIEFGLVVVFVDRPSDWRSCRLIARRASCPVAVVTDYLAADRRYRKRAFGMGVAVYIRKPCTKARLREMMKQLAAGTGSIELVASARRRSRVNRCKPAVGRSG
jgi:AmiR/NasT family two-component response regulator